MTTLEEFHADQVAAKLATDIEALEHLYDTNRDDAYDAIADWIEEQPFAGVTFLRVRDGVDDPEWTGAELLLLDGQTRATLRWSNRGEHATLEVTYGTAWTARRICIPHLAAQLRNLI